MRSNCFRFCSRYKKITSRRRAKTGGSWNSWFLYKHLREVCKSDAIETLVNEKTQLEVDSWTDGKPMETTTNMSAEIGSNLRLRRTRGPPLACLPVLHLVQSSFDSSRNTRILHWNTKKHKLVKVLKTVQKEDVGYSKCIFRTCDVLLCILFHRITHLNWLHFDEAYARRRHRIKHM